MTSAEKQFLELALAAWRASKAPARKQLRLIVDAVAGD